ncbi:MAG: hypothetical protein AAF092_06405 [Pseudomonadota bacterium]
MSDDLDDRIAYLRQQRQLEGAAQTQKAADLIHAIDELQELVRTTSFKATTVQGHMQVLEGEMGALESRVKRTHSFLIGGIAAAGLLGALILLAALWSSSNLKSAARTEADALRILYADQIEAARLEGDAELAALQSEILTQRSDIEHQIIKVVADSLKLRMNAMRLVWHLKTWWTSATGLAWS